jgi:hypothetical protein
LTEFVDAHRGRFGVEPICTVIEFPVSTYYAAKKREECPSDRELRDEELVPLIREVWETKGNGCMARGKCGGNCVVTVWWWRGARSSG